MIPAAVRDHLRLVGGRYKARTLPAGKVAEALKAARLSPESVAKVSVAVHGSSALMVVHPMGYEPDLGALEALFQHPVLLAEGRDIERIFPGCQLSAIPPLPGAFGIKAVIDIRLARAEEVFFFPGRENLLVRATREDFAALTRGAWIGPVAKALAKESHDKKVWRPGPNALPAIPRMSMELFKLRGNPYASASELCAILAQDPALSEQVVRYASLPLFGYKGRLESLNAAVTEVLGMDFVTDLAFGLSVTRRFCEAIQSPVALTRFWQHAIYAGALTQALSLRMPYLQRPPAGIAYLSGLLHNFGFLLIGHLFPDRVERLKAGLDRHPEKPLVELEHELIGLAHTELGLRLMESWGMSKDIAEAASEHHNPEFRRGYSTCPGLVYIANTMLKRYGIGDAEKITVPRALLGAVGLDEVEAEAALGLVVENRKSLDLIVRRMAA